jgi:hypothetical protein
MDDCQCGNITKEIKNLIGVNFDTYIWVAFSFNGKVANTCRQKKINSSISQNK